MNVVLSTLLVVSSLAMVILGIIGFRHRNIAGVKAISLLMFALAIHSKTMNLVDKFLHQAKNAGRNAVVSEEAVVRCRRITS